MKEKETILFLFFTAGLQIGVKDFHIDLPRILHLQLLVSFNVGAAYRTIIWY